MQTNQYNYFSSLDPNALYDIIDDIDEQNVGIPSDSGSDNDSSDEKDQDADWDASIGLVPNDEEPEYVISASDDSDSEWDAEDLVPLAQLAAEMKTGRQISWDKGLTSIQVPVPFAEDTGLPQFIKNLSNPSPLDIFSLLITDDIINHIVFQTNLYAEQKFTAKGKSYKRTNSDEIRAFLGLNLLMGIKQYPSYRDHWSTAPDLHDPYISRIMTLHRFGWLLSNIHLNDNTVMPARGTINYDKLYKVKPFLETLKANFQNCLQPHENVAVDESMIKFKGRMSIKQYMPKKPVKRGYKVWMLADSSGYCLNFEIYVGKVGNEVEHNLGARVVKNMTSELANKNHKVFFDNFFTGVPLMEELRQQQLYACGTINSTRKKMPKFKTDKELKRGEFDWYTSNTGLAAVKWRDRRSVHLLSNYHDPSSSTEVKRKEKDGTHIQVPCPIMLRDYNKNMNFVDKFDQLRSCYGIDRKSHKWWHRIFFFFIDSALVNAFIIYKLLGTTPQLSMKNFRRQVSEGLVSNNLVKRLSLPVPTELSLPIKKHKPSVSKSVRLTASAHQPMRTTRRRCAVCSTKNNDIRTNWQCSVCNVPLCLGALKTCFQSYHRNT